MHLIHCILPIASDTLHSTTPPSTPPASDNDSAHPSTPCSAAAHPGSPYAPRISPGSLPSTENLWQPSDTSDNHIEAEGSKSLTVQAKLKEVIASKEKLKYENLVALLENHPWEEATQELFKNDEDYTEYDYGDFDYDSSNENVNEPVENN